MMSRPTNQTKFLPISELIRYCDGGQYFCSGIVFSPSTENDHFSGCPPYIRITHKSLSDDEDIFFEVPEIVAYYGDVHAGYTMAGNKRSREARARELAGKLKSLLNL